MTKKADEYEDDSDEEYEDLTGNDQERSRKKNAPPHHDGEEKKKKKQRTTTTERRRTKGVQLVGARSFRARLVLSTLSRKRVRMTRIRWRSSEPGLRPHEASFLRLADKLTSGSRVEINETGTALSYAPGAILGGALEHDCSRSGRGVGWFVEGLLPFAPFCRQRLELTLLGPTCGGPGWRAVDALKHGPVAWLRDALGLDVELDVVRRQALSSSATTTVPSPPGKVVLRCAPARALAPVDMREVGLVKNVRGVAYCTRVAPALANRIVEAARARLNPYLADVRITTDAAAKRDSAPGPGFGLALVATTTADRKIAADLDVASLSPDTTPEDLADRCAVALLDDLARNGAVDSLSQSLLLTFMVLTDEAVSVATLPDPLTPAAVDRLRLLKTFFGLEFTLTRDPLQRNVRCACLGLGFTNVSRTVT
mmetsp:Transcript_408/g.1166  ORF Transcript_408/g.1166 Transcript_408/m.1166 type:complete len:426 (+) Transcript_408:91-1368(+)